MPFSMPPQKHPDSSTQFASTSEILFWTLKSEQSEVLGEYGLFFPFIQLCLLSFDLTTHVNDTILANIQQVKMPG